MNRGVPKAFVVSVTVSITTRCTNPAVSVAAVKHHVQHTLDFLQVIHKEHLAIVRGKSGKPGRKTAEATG